MILGFHTHDMRLILNIFRMKLRDRYLGSRLGLAWAVLQPMLLLGVYTFVFGFIYRPPKLPDAEVNLRFVIWLISGFVPYLAISESLMGTASSVTGGSAPTRH